MAERRDIVLARFPFTDLTGARLRPVLVLTEIPGAYHDFIVLFISSQVSQALPGLDIILDPGHPAFGASGLRATSVLRIAKVASLSEALILGTLGRLEESIFDEVIRRLTRLLQSGQFQSSP